MLLFLRMFLERRSMAMKLPLPRLLQPHEDCLGGYLLF
jgi:hypothetical protein